MSPNAGGFGWGGRGSWRSPSQWIQLYRRSPINFGDLPPYLTYEPTPSLPTEWGTFQEQNITFWKAITVSVVFICSCLCSVVPSCLILRFAHPFCLCSLISFSLQVPRVLLAGAGVPICGIIISWSVQVPRVLLAGAARRSPSAGS